MNLHTRLARLEAQHHDTHGAARWAGGYPIELVLALDVSQPSITALPADELDRRVAAAREAVGPAGSVVVVGVPGTPGYARWAQAWETLQHMQRESMGDESTNAVDAVGSAANNE